MIFFLSARPLKGETEQYVARTKAIDEKLIHVIAMLGDQVFVERVTTAVAPAAIAAGVTTGDMMAQLFGGTPFEGVFKSLAERPLGKKMRVAAGE